MGKIKGGKTGEKGSGSSRKPFLLAAQIGAVGQPNKLRNVSTVHTPSELEGHYARPTRGSPQNNGGLAEWSKAPDLREHPV